MVIECKIMYAAPFDPQYFKSDICLKKFKNLVIPPKCRTFAS